MEWPLSRSLFPAPCRRRGVLAVSAHQIMVQPEVSLRQQPARDLRAATAKANHPREIKCSRAICSVIRNGPNILNMRPVFLGGASDCHWTAHNDAFMPDGQGVIDSAYDAETAARGVVLLPPRAGRPKAATRAARDAALMGIVIRIRFWPKLKPNKCGCFSLSRIIPDRPTNTPVPAP